MIALPGSRRASAIMAFLLDAARTPLFRKIAVRFVTFMVAIASLVALLRFTPVLEVAHRKGYHIPLANMDPVPLVDLCTATERANASSPSIWKHAKTKYDELLEDQFTIAIQTYRRPKELQETLKTLTVEKIPSLHEIVIVWNDLGTPPPRDYSTLHGVPVRYRVSKRNSLNEKLWPDPAYQTQAVLLSDDDVYYQPDDLEFVFQSWRKFGKYRMVGALPRCAEIGRDGTWKYTFCPTNRQGKQPYSMVLTNLSFAHVAMLEYYSSDDPYMVKVREYVDKNFNCEDIAMNHLTGLLTGDGPLLVRGREEYHNMEPSKGISTKPGHMKARSKCINDFADIFGCMALVKEEAYIGFGA